MAHRKVRLSALRVTQIPTTGSKSVDVVHRGSKLGSVDTQLHYPDLHTNSPGDPSHDSFGGDLLLDSTMDLEEPTEHELGCKFTVAGWEAIRNGRCCHASGSALCYTYV